MEYGLIGGVLKHSYSKSIHEQIADYSYELKELEPRELEGFLRQRAFQGINVTIPYKQDVIPFLDVADEMARRIGAVNTVVNRSGKLYGYNTDFDGMKALVKKTGIGMQGKKVLILGTGGTSRTACAVAESLGAKEILPVSRKPSAVRRAVPEGQKFPAPVTYEEAAASCKDAQILINTTPSGMYPHVEEVPVDICRFPELEGVLDAVYNPLRSNLVLNAKERGIPASGGLYMLSAQAVFSCGFFLNRTMNREDIDRAYRKVLLEKQNIVLCGMPSCGKTTVARRLSALTGREVLDTDEIFIRHHGMPIAEFSARYGERAFRDRESEAVKEAAKEAGKIIATGGGAILREENVRALKRNGRLFFIDRPLNLLTPTADRPFSADPEALKKRYEERYDLYRRTADFRVDGSGTAGKVAKTIHALFCKAENGLLTEQGGTGSVLF